MHYTLALTLHSLLPNIVQTFIDTSIERNHSELCNLCKRVQLCKEGCQHSIRNRTRLVNSNSNLCSSRRLLAGMLVRIPLVNLTNSASLVSLLALLHKVSQHLAPVNLCGNTIHDFLATTSRNGAPSTGRRVCLFNCILDKFLYALLGNLLCLIIGLPPTTVVVKGVHIIQGTSATSTGLAFTRFSTITALTFAITFRLLFLHLAKLRQIPFGSLASRQVLERTLTRETSHLGKVGKMTIDRKVHCYIVQLPFLRVHVPKCSESSTSNMLINNVIEFVL